MVLILYAHPYPQHSRAGKALLDAVGDLPGLETRSLYDLYPDFDIDVAAEQAALTRAELVVWLHPVYWYSVPSMLKHWFDVVLLRGWAYGKEGNALRGKRCLWAAEAEARLAAWMGDAAVPAEALLFNNMEPPAFTKFIALPVLLEQLQARFGLQARMSGSGSACFALLRDDTDAGPVIAAVRDAWGESAFVIQARLT